MKRLLLGHNELSGSIERVDPSGAGGLNQPPVARFGINWLSGEIPVELGPGPGAEAGRFRWS